MFCAAILSNHPTWRNDVCMPNRIVREGILTSERVELLSWAEEVFYRRLMSVVDDFGRYYARPALLRAACYPLLLTKVSDSDIEKWLSACENAALVRVYPASDGKRYLQLLDFRQHIRAAESKYPPPPDDCDASAVHVQRKRSATEHVDVDVDVDVDEKRAPRSRATLSRPDDVDEQTWTDWLALRKAKRAAVTPTVIDGARREAGKAGMALDAFLREWCERGSQGLKAEWLRPADLARPHAQPKHAAAARAIYGAPEPPETIDVEAVVRQH